MNSITERLWNGTLSPCHDCGSSDPEVKDLLDLMQRNSDALMQILSPQQQEFFQKYQDCGEEYCYLISAHAFSDGFSLAVRLMAEAMSPA